MRRVVFILLLLIGCASLMAQSQQEEGVVRIDPIVRNGQLYMDADIVFSLNEAWRQTLQKGLPAYFTADLELVSPRWWWFDKVIVAAHKTWKVSYNTLTRQWRISSGDLALPALSLDEALAQVRHIRGWNVARIADIDVDQKLQGRLRLRLDTSLLAQPLQIEVLNSQRWNWASPWKHFSFSVITSPADPS